MQAIRPIMAPELRLALMKAPEFQPTEHVKQHMRHIDYSHRMARARTNPIIIPTSIAPGRAPFRHEVDVLGPGILEPQPGDVCARHSWPMANGECHGRCVDAVFLDMCAACRVFTAMGAITPRMGVAA